MRLELVKYTCANCKRHFDIPSLGENAYGEFLLRSGQGNVAYLNALEDSTYNEVDSLLAGHPKTSRLRPLDRAKVLRRIYGKLACDGDEKNAKFGMETVFPCPFCGSQKMASWEFKNPPEIVHVSISPITHRHWNTLTDREKLILVDAELNAV